MAEGEIKIRLYESAGGSQTFEFYATTNQNASLCIGLINNNECKIMMLCYNCSRNGWADNWLLMMREGWINLNDVSARSNEKSQNVH